MDTEATLEKTSVQGDQPEIEGEIDPTLIESAETTYAKIDELCSQLNTESKELSIRTKPLLEKAVALIEETRKYAPQKGRTKK